MNAKLGQFFSNSFTIESQNFTEEKNDNHVDTCVEQHNSFYFEQQLTVSQVLLI